MQQATDFLEESEALHVLVSTLSSEQLQRAVAFKGWTFEEILRHLHVWNLAAGLSLDGDGAFGTFFEVAGPHVEAGTMRSFERDWQSGLEGRSLVAAWRAGVAQLASRFRAVDPSLRVEWAGPSMSARSSITARLMETWAHGQAIYDALGVVRRNTDRIRNIVVLGFNTYGWSFEVRGEAPPEPRPSLLLTAPSGVPWSYGDPELDERVEGRAEEFCQVVTQTRNVDDTELRVVGRNAAAWMARAQCFAGPAEKPPAPGARRTTRT